MTSQLVCEVDEFGTKIWTLNGELHREDGPAVEYPDGSKQWWLNGKCHRENGPAVEINGHEAWLLDGKLHRTDGPAQTWDNGSRCCWWINGNQVLSNCIDNLVLKTKYPKLVESMVLYLVHNS